jgi:hypothetical protein
MRKLFRQRLLAVLASLGITIPSSLFAPRAVAQARTEDDVAEKFELWRAQRVSFPVAVVTAAQDALSEAFDAWCATRDFVVSDSPRG